jgi:hypothetical protein
MSATVIEFPGVEGDTMSPLLDADTAKGLTSAIVQGLEGLTKAVDALCANIEQAFEGRAWEALGYNSWASYVVAEFGPALYAFNATARKALLPSMHLSRKDAALIFGVTERTVQRDRNPKAPKVEEPPLSFEEAMSDVLDVVGGETQGDNIADEPCLLNMVAEEIRKLTSEESVRYFTPGDREHLRNELLAAIERIDRVSGKAGSAIGDVVDAIRVLGAATPRQIYSAMRSQFADIEAVGKWTDHISDALADGYTRRTR